MVRQTHPRRVFITYPQPRRIAGRSTPGHLWGLATSVAPVTVRYLIGEL